MTVTDEMVERVARGICAMDGHDPDHQPLSKYPNWRIWRRYECIAREALRRRAIDAAVTRALSAPALPDGRG